MSIVLKEEGKEDIMKRAIFLRLPITQEQLNGPLEVIWEYPKGEDYLIAIPRCFQKMAISKKFCS
jgi:hypothetical protein